MPTYQAHQQRVLDRLESPDTKGLIAYHSLGSGKTLTALGAFDNAKVDSRSKGLFIVPASLVENVNKELIKHKMEHLRPGIDVISYDKAVNRSRDLLRKKYKLVVLDEAHRLRNKDTKRVQNLAPIIRQSDKTLMLTGTAGYNHPADIMSLINVINPQLKLPDTHKDFEDAYIDNVTWKLKNKKQLQRILSTYVDRYQTPTATKDFPTISRRRINVEMSPKQVELYRVLERNIPSEIRSKLERNLPMTLKDTTALNVFAQGVRQAADSTVHHDISSTWKDSNKIQVAAQRMARASRSVPGFRGLVYSNYVDAGLTPYAEALRAQRITPLVFTGRLSQLEKKQLVDAYNRNTKDPQVLLISSSGGEGLDLKNTRLVQLLEPHFNKSKLKQAEGRAIRYKSHASLPENQRNVVVEEYLSTLPKTRLQRFFNRPADTAIDGYLADASDKKQQILDDIDKLIY